MQSLFSLLESVYDFMIMIPGEIADFFEKILDDLLDGATDILS
jgi:hypothetical protein